MTSDTQLWVRRGASFSLVASGHRSKSSSSRQPGRGRDLPLPTKGTYQWGEFELKNIPKQCINYIDAVLHWGLLERVTASNQKCLFLFSMYPQSSDHLPKCKYNPNHSKNSKNTFSKQQTTTATTTTTKLRNSCGMSVGWTEQLQLDQGLVLSRNW